MLTEEYGQSAVLRDPMRAALVTFAAFALAGAVPLLPYIAFLPDAGYWSLGLTSVVFFGVGALKSIWSLGHWARSGLETLAIGSTAAAVAYIAGDVIEGLL